MMGKIVGMRLPSMLISAQKKTPSVNWGQFLGEGQVYL